MDLEDLDFIAAMARELLAIDEGYKAEYEEFGNIINRELTSSLHFNIVVKEA